MTSPLRRRIRHTRRWLGYGGLVVLILFAALVGVANQMLPLVERHPDKVAAWLSERVGEPVHFARAHAEWTRRGPRIILDGLTVGQGAQILDIGRAELLVAVYSGLLPNHPLTELKVRELSLSLVQGEDRRWRVLGLPGQQLGDPLDRLQGFGELQVEKARLAVRSPQLKIDTTLPRVDLRFRVNGSRLRTGAAIWSDARSAPLNAVLDLQRDTSDGTLWVGGEQLVLAHWAPMLASAGIVPRTGDAGANVWLRLRDQRVEQLTVELQAQRVVLESTVPLDLADGRAVPASARFDRLKTTARWTMRGEEWQLQVPELEIGQAGGSASLGGLRARGGDRLAIVADELDLAPVAALLSLSDRLPPRLRSFLSQARPTAVLHEVSVHRLPNGALRGSARVSGLVLQPHDKQPGVHGVSGALRFDARGGAFTFAPGTVRVDWPVGLRQPLDMSLRGTVAWWKEGEGWSVGTDALRVAGKDFGVDTRLLLAFQDSSLPRMDLAANLDPSSFASAKKFWIMHKMPAATVKWLDEALVEGQVLDGRVSIGGDLDDWPFRDHSGVFDARATVRDATLKFHPDWPAGRDMDIDLAFDGPGFTLAGTGEIQGTRVDTVSGGIPDFQAPLLALDIAASGSGAKLRELLINSPINKDYGEHLKAARIDGRSDVAVQLALPLKAGLAGKRIEGTVDLAAATLSDARWKLRFTKVSGRTRFSDRGFASENLKVTFDGQPGVFSLRVGEFAGDAKLAALATLDGRFTPPTLIDRAGDLAWLKPWMSGSSFWKVAVRIPKSLPGKPAPPSELRVVSDLAGTALTMPAPLNKPAATNLPLEVVAALPVEQGEIAVRLGDVMRFRGLVRAKAPMSGSLQFGAGAVAAPRAAGLSVRGVVPLLDAAGWIAFSSKGEGGGALHDIDIRATQLNLVDRAFADTRLRLDKTPNTTLIRLDGAGIEGVVDIPDDGTRVVQAKFSRLYLAAESAGASGASVPATVEVDDPAKLPPLDFAIADLRMGQAQFGQASLQTTPLANGMRVDRFQTRARTLNLDAAGEWVRTGTGTRSNFRLDFSANSLGQMLDALGFAGMVEGGKTKATLSGSWPGSPGAFSLSTMSGNLHADVGEGRLLDVEPGGSGRVLGLISLAEIPRRLSLDFSDFFAKGFAFNNARGDFVFNDGRARTDNLRIDGPAAEIRVSGTTGLRDETYDQRIEVLPKAGGILPAIGLIAGGPAGAAVGVMAQAVLQKPLKQTTRVVYRVSGSWKQPKVVVTERGPPRGGTASVRPAPGEP